MKKIIVFGSKHWPDCGPAEEYLSENNIEYEYVDITSSMGSLKKYLEYRDHHEAFIPIKEIGIVGIPCISINDGEEVIFDYKKLRL